MIETYYTLYYGLCHIKTYDDGKRDSHGPCHYSLGEIQEHFQSSGKIAVMEVEEQRRMKQRRGAKSPRQN